MVDGYSLDRDTRLVYLGERMDIWRYQLLADGTWWIIGDYQIMLQLSNAQVLTYLEKHKLPLAIELTLFRAIACWLIRRRYEHLDIRKNVMFTVLAGNGVWYLSDCLKRQHEECGYVNPIKCLNRVLTNSV